jgi:hypothetical protein
MSGGVSNVTVENVLFTKANKPADIKVGNTRGGYVRNIIFQDLTVTGQIERAIHVDTVHYNDSPNPSCPADWKPPALPDVSDLHFLRFNGTEATFAGSERFPNEVFHFLGYDENPIRDVHMEDLFFPTPNNGIGWNCSGVQGSVKNNSVTPWPPCDNMKVVNSSSNLPRQYPVATEDLLFAMSRNYLWAFAFLTSLVLLYHRATRKM